MNLATDLTNALHHTSSSNIASMGNNSGDSLRQIDNGAGVRQVATSSSNDMRHIEGNNSSVSICQIGNEKNGGNVCRISNRINDIRPSGQSGTSSGGSASSSLSQASYSSSRNNDGSGGSTASILTGSPAFPGMVSQALYGIGNVRSHSLRGSGRRGAQAQCKSCNLIFLNQSALNMHTEEVHRSESKPYQCAQCPQSFMNYHQLAQHNRNHSTEKPYKCTFCDKCFKHLSTLQQHMRLHTGERPYKCSLPDCGRSFVQLANLQQHIRNHDTQARNRPYKCDICGKGFVAEVSLITHCSTQHSGVVGPGAYPTCSICHHMFATRESLMQHIHTKH